MKKIALALAAAGVLASVPALADMDRNSDRRMDRYPSRADDARATIDALERRDDALQRESEPMRIGAVERRQISLQRDLIDDLIDRLQRGERVDAYQVERAFEPYTYQRG